MVSKPHFKELSKIYNKFKSNKYTNKRELIIDTFNCHIGPIYKTKLLDKVTSFYYSGYADASFISKGKEVKNVFNKMVKDGEIVFEPNKPLTLNIEE